MNFILAMAAPQGGGGGSMVSTLIMMASIFAIFYFMIIRPQQKKAKEREQMLSAIQKGDKVILSGGIHGTVAGLEEKTALIQISDNVKIKVERAAINIIEK